MSSRIALHRALLAALILAGTTTIGSLPAGSLSAGSLSAGSAIPAVALSSAAPSGRYIVRWATGPSRSRGPASLTREIADLGGRVHSVLPAVGMLVADLPRSSLDRASRLPGVLGLAPDRSARPLSLGFDPAGQPGALVNVTRATGAQALWRAGLTGAGVDVALIDTGLAPVPALADPDKVVVGPDLSFDSQDPQRRYLDGYGHGTHIGSIIAGRQGTRADGAGYADDSQNFYGMAPDARLVSVKVGARDGAVDVSQLIAAIDWVVQNRQRDGLDIKVLNLSFGTDSAQPWVLDPLAQAAEVASRAGILVVVAGGNDGESARGLADPAYSPRVLAVGAVDTQGTDRYNDDLVPSFSQHSDSVLRSRPPDLVAPGVGVVASAVPGSTLAGRYPGALIGDGFLRGSGTSQAAAVVSGAAALLWQKWPDLSAVQVRELLVDSSTRLGRNQAFEGHGELNLVATLARPPLSPVRAAAALALPDWRALGIGSLQAARGSNALSLDGVELRGERDIFGHAWNGRLLAGLTSDERAWSDHLTMFNGNAWIGPGFTADTVSLAGRTWNGRTWAGRTWAGLTWTGQTWTGRTWAGDSWASHGWACDSWS